MVTVGAVTDLSTALLQTLAQCLGTFNKILKAICRDLIKIHQNKLAQITIK